MGIMARTQRANKDKRKQERKLMATADFPARFGSLSTRAEIAEASNFLATLGISEDDYHEHEYLKEYIDSLPRSEFAWRELEIYRMVDETSSYFMGPRKPDFTIICELELVIQTWSHLALAGGLGRVLQPYKNVQQLKEQGASPAEVLRAFFKAYKIHHNIWAWKAEAMNILRHHLVQLDKDFRQLKKEPTLLGPVHIRFKDSEAPKDTVTLSQSDKTSKKKPLTSEADLPKAKKSKSKSKSNGVSANSKVSRKPIVKTDESHQEENLYDLPPWSGSPCSDHLSARMSALSIKSSASIKEPTSLPGFDTIARYQAPQSTDDFITPAGYLGLSVQENLQRLQTNLDGCTEQCQAALALAEAAVDSLSYALKGECALRPIIDGRLKTYVSKIQEGLLRWNGNDAKAMATQFTDLTTSSQDTALQLIDQWKVAAETFGNYSLLKLDLEKWQRKVDAAGEAFGDD